MVVFGLADLPQTPREPLVWLCDYLDQAQGESRILHFNYHPSQILAPGHAHYGINTLAELLLDRLTRLRVGSTVSINALG